MATAEIDPVPAPALPDYLSDPNAVLKDPSKWRYGKAPDYSKTRTVFEQTKKQSHEASSLPSLVENLVKNWEIEASFKPQLSDWRTIDHPNYSFAINGGPPQTAEHMLKVGTYNAIIAPNEFYSPANSDFASSHKTFKRMMPTFAWEVLEVYSGPPQVAFRWRHWGEMKNDYVGFNDKGEKITAKAHSGSIDIEGVTVALVDDQVRLQKVETWFDPLEMFRQIAPNGIVNKEVHEKTASDEIDNRMATDGVHNAKPEADVLEVIEQAKQLKETPQGDETNRIEPTDGNQPPAPSKTESSEPAIANSSQAQSDREHKQSQALVDSAAPMISTQTQDDGTNKSPQSEAANSTKALDEPQPRTPSNFKSNENIPVVEPPAESLAAQSRAELHPTSSNSFESTHPDNKTKFGNNLEESKLSEQNQEGTLLTKNTESSAVPLPLSDIPAPGVPGPLPNETQSHRPQPGNQDALNQILAALQSVQSDYRQVSAKIDRFGERIRSLEGGQSNVNGATSIPSHAVATATSIPGNAVATAPESDETRRTHEEMSRITASECPFLMNSE